MLLLNNLEFKRSEKTIFENISFSANSGKIILLKGSNGSGKTTLIKTIINILEPTNGEVFWMGEKIKKNIFNFYKNTTFIMDKTTSAANLTIMENISFWKNLSLSKIKKDEVIRLLNILELTKYQNTKVMYLSMGEIKKLELTRLIIEKKKLWILDEPYNNLDSSSIEIISQTFADHADKKGIILLASHYEPNIKDLEIFNLN
ncbi:MAG: Cytochrome c biogenesis ATP-binding export protein CcmA [Alphaproteobacteria bacterium MarineAlpha5_Bin5]|nr:MAG: Cytochrome c biogenesis ATP-binding export protein CcmA [Alphaproteobacteria bacterium MarineAlpha5_Bin4]PPR50161.1 MAG: Cytochrome c biogenesis ATP-binding export protein CcmA [Alphaproteobacteria bacterium MarineAlpha5_Bin5]|tara:strand:+ start:5504 stop:6112 length:609 start_codon:yes stop_codon:yes gene_type:complete